VSFRTLLIVALALVFGGSVAVGINSIRSQEPPVPKTEIVPVVVAAADIPRGRTVTAELLKTEDWPKDRVPEGASTTAADLVDRVAYLPLVKGEIVLGTKLTPKGGGRGMGALTRQGMRSFTIPTPNIASGVAGFILPGDRVDVLLTVADSGDKASGGGTTTTLQQNVEILAVDQRVDAPNENKVDPKELRSVTLLVTPDQAAQLALGQNKGTLQLSLRNPRDDKDANPRPATLASLRLTQGKPWDERAKTFFDAMGKALAKMPAPKEDPKKAAEPAVPQGPPPPITIRTLRGSQEGRVVVSPRWAPAGR
jgi:pilus assembly protein CpaB